MGLFRFLNQWREKKDGTLEGPALNTDETHTETIGANDYHYAGDYDGSDADTRLTNAISAASDGDTIYLENAVYTSDLTVPKPLCLIGTSNISDLGTAVNASAWVFDGTVLLDNIAWYSSTDLTINSNQSHIRDNRFGSTQSITLNSNSIGVTGCQSGNITFTSGTTNGMVDACWNGTTVTDNGTNTVGDIA